MMNIQVKYEDIYTTYTVSSFDEIRNEEVVSIDCCHNNLESLPENMNFPNLKYFYCSNNNLVSLPDNMNFPNLETFYCHNNLLETLPGNMNFPNLKTFSCNNNLLESLPENLNLPNLQNFDCSHNKLISLPENMDLPGLRYFYCNNNKLKSLPLCIMNFHNLRNIYYTNNEIDNIPIQLLRFINRLKQTDIKKLNVYNDNQNIHNSSIQLSVKDSINNLTTRKDISQYNKDLLIKRIISDDTLNCKEQLIDYINDDNIHSLLLLTFGEVLWYLLETVEKDFDLEVQKEIKNILNTDMSDALCKCFTGRISRVINCLSGFSDLVNIQIKDESQIGNVIVLIKEKLLGDYSVEEHKRLVRIELLDRGYEKEVIEEWVSYIE